MVYTHILGKNTRKPATWDQADCLQRNCNPRDEYEAWALESGGPQIVLSLRCLLTSHADPRFVFLVDVKEVNHNHRAKTDSADCC